MNDVLDLASALFLFVLSAATCLFAATMFDEYLSRRRTREFRRDQDDPTRVDPPD